MPCHRSCKQFVPRSAPPTYDEALHQNSSLHLSVGTYAARYQPYSLSYRFEGEYMDIPVPQTPAIVPQTDRFIVPPHFNLDDYLAYDSEEVDEDEDAWDSDDEDDDDVEENGGHHYHYDGTLKVLAAAPLCVLVLLVWASYFV